MPTLAEQFADVVRYLESLETEERIKALPHLLERAPNVEVGDKWSKAEDGAPAGDGTASLRHRGLRDFSLDLLPIKLDSYAALTRLDVSNNELTDLPGLASLPNLEVLSLQRNWFKALPAEIGQLQRLKELDASRNFLRPNEASLGWDDLRQLAKLRTIDLQYNQKVCRAEHREAIRNALLPQKVAVLVTVWEEMAKAPGGAGALHVGACAAQRNPVLLRSQLESWGTVHLRRRLVRDFGQEPTPARDAGVDRAGVMERLLQCYRNEGLLYIDDNASGEDLNAGIGKRRTVRIDGIPVRDELLHEILTELREWRGNRRRGGSSINRERPSIDARSYMILRAPGLGENAEGDAPSRRARRMNRKMERNQRLWDLAIQAMEETDPVFAKECSEIAVTFGFTGSPHIDKQNSTPFYGLSLGDFAEGTGCVMVECSARVVAKVNTKGRLGRIDGRHPHWVTDYEGTKERFSLIYYDTVSPFQTPGPAIFSTPSNDETT